MKRLISLICFFAILNGPMNLRADESAQQSKFSTAGKIAKTYALPVLGAAAIGYFAMWSYLISHEFGHALMSKWLYKSPIDISLGRKSTDSSDKKPLFTIGGVKVYSLLPMYGYARYILPSNATKAKNSAITAAGGVAGVLQGLTLLLALSAYASYKNNKGAKDICLGGLKNACFPFSNAGSLSEDPLIKCVYGATTAGLLATNLGVLEQSLLPNNSLTGSVNADGTKLWQLNGFSDETLKGLGWAEFSLEIATIVSVLAYWGWLTYKDMPSLEDDYK